MTMERSSAWMTAAGDHDLAHQMATIHTEFTRRHPDLRDIPLTGKLPGESRLDPSLEGKARTVELTIGGKTGKQLLDELAKKRVDIGGWARTMVENPKFTPLPDSTKIEMAITEARNLKPRTSYPTTEEIFKGAEDKGLDLLPAETLLHYLLQQGDRLKVGNIVLAGMKPIAASNHHPGVFRVGRGYDGLWLHSDWAEPSGEWYPSSRFAFRIRK